MAIVTHQLQMPDGSIPVNASVRIRLVAAISGSAEGHVLGAASIGGVSYPAIDNTGTWTANLTPNASIVPAGTVYEIMETLAGQTPTTLYIAVPGAGGRVENLLTVPPTTLGGALPGSKVPSDYIEGIPLYGYGNSLMYGGVAAAPYFNRVAQRIRSVASFNRGVGGALAADASLYANGSYPQAWVAPSPTIRGRIVLIDVVRNDAGWDFLSPVKARAGFTNGLDSLIRVIRSQPNPLQDTNAAFVYAGAWTSAASGVYPGGNTHYSTTAGNTATITTPVGTDFDLLISGGDGNLISCSAFTITVDGADITASLAAQGYPTTGANQCYMAHSQIGSATGPLAIPLRGLSNQAHTVVITVSGGGILLVSRLLQADPNPPTIVIFKAAYLSPTGYQVNYGGGGTPTDDIYNALIDTVIGRFPADQSIVAIDLNRAGWNPATMIPASGTLIHGGDIGAAFIADQIVSKLNSLPSRLGLLSV